MKRTLLALAIGTAALLPAAPAAQAAGCTNPVGVLCQPHPCGDNPCTPVFCAVWLNGRCVL